MRFKTDIKNAPLFLRFTQSMEKINKQCVVHLSVEKIEFILVPEQADGVQVWSGMNTASLFEEYRIESMNNNELSFEIELPNLQRALKSAQFASKVTMKLAKNKKGLPILIFHIESQTAQISNIVQQIPINIISAQQLAKLTEPVFPDPDVYILMPPLKSVQKVVDKMKNISEMIQIEANMAGKLKLSVGTEVATISTFYNNLDHPQIEGANPPPQSEDITAAVLVDIKKFIAFLHSNIIRPTTVILCLMEQKAVVIHVLLDDLYMTYILPVLLQ